MEKKTEELYEIANIQFSKSHLKIDTTAYSLANKHYDVKVTRNDDGSITVNAEEPHLVMSLSTRKAYDSDLETFTEDSFEEYKPWP